MSEPGSINEFWTPERIASAVPKTKKRCKEIQEEDNVSSQKERQGTEGQEDCSSANHAHN